MEVNPRVAKIPSDLVPQADKLEKILDVLEAVRGGTYDVAELARICNLPSARQGGYYRQALRALDFARVEGGRWVPTDLGEALADVDSHKQKVALLKRLVPLNPAVDLVCNVLREAGARGAEIDELSRILQEAADLSPATAMRRTGTILRWLAYLGLVESKGVRYALNLAPRVVEKHTPH
jgi:hypothetical protein